MTEASLGRITVIIPARNEAQTIGALVERVARQAPADAELEVLVVDDGSSDATAAEAERAGARVLRRPADGARGNPAAARNLAASAAHGDLLVFLDADCTPADGWLEALRRQHARGHAVVGGSLDMPPGLPASARADYYAGWYHVHSRRPAGAVPSHPPGNLSVRRSLLLGSVGFTEHGPAAYAHEELEWQAELRESGHPIHFAPEAIVFHRNRPGLGNLWRRSYRWGYSAVELKARTGAARLAWLYRHPRLLVLSTPLFAVAQTFYIASCWVRARMYEPLLLLPFLLLARIAWCSGMAVGTFRWLRRRQGRGARPRWE